jgi:hypothetical protein
VVIVGYDLKERKFIFKNSWGRDWGSAGYGKLPFRYIDQYSHHRPIVTYLNQKLNLPERATEVPAVSIEGAHVEVQDHSDPNRRVVVNFEGNLQSEIHSIFYVSTYLVSGPSDGVGDREATDSNTTLLSVPTGMQGEFGAYIKGTYYHQSRESDGDTVALRATNEIPYRAISEDDLKRKDLFLRVTAYYHSDDGWVKLYRVYRPWISISPLLTARN